MKVIHSPIKGFAGRESVKTARPRPWPSGSYFCVPECFDPYPFCNPPLLLERPNPISARNLEDGGLVV